MEQFHVVPKLIKTPMLVAVATVQTQSLWINTVSVLTDVKALASQASILKDSYAALLLEVIDVRAMSIEDAAAGMKSSIQDRLTLEEGLLDKDVEFNEWTRDHIWKWEYGPLRRVNKAWLSLISQKQAS
jgi:malate dehydrogenase (oxaloacetate-decarboxylating)